MDEAQTPEVGAQSVELLASRKPVVGMEHFDASDLVVPIIKLIQGSSDVKAGRPGQFINTATNEVMDAAELILITYAKETKDWDDGKGPKPQYKFLALDRKTKWPVFLYVGGTSLWTAKAYLNSFWMLGIPLWYSVTSLSSKQKDNKSGLGKYHVMEFDQISDTDEDTRKYCYNFYDKYGKKMIESRFEEDVEAATGVTDISAEDIDVDSIPV